MAPLWQQVGGELGSLGPRPSPSAAVAANTPLQNPALPLKFENHYILSLISYCDALELFSGNTTYCRVGKKQVTSR